MMIFDPIRNFIRNLDRHEMIRWVSLYLGLCLCIIIGIFVRHVMSVNELKSKITQLNKQRSAVQAIFTKYQAVQQQKTKVEEAFKNNKSFNIQKFYQDLVSKHHISGIIPPKFERKPRNNYIEESLNISISQIDTKQLCDILLDIEHEPLVYVKFVDINKMNLSKKINVNMSIATLRIEE